MTAKTPNIMYWPFTTWQVNKHIAGLRLLTSRLKGSNNKPLSTTAHKWHFELKLLIFWTELPLYVSIYVKQFMLVFCQLLSFSTHGHTWWHVFGINELVDFKLPQNQVIPPLYVLLILLWKGRGMTGSVGVKWCQGVLNGFWPLRSTKSEPFS